jgi:hypothetical protein
MHWQGHALNYIWELENQGRHKHIIWPTHCVLGDEIEMPQELIGQAKKYRPCREYLFKRIGEDPLGLQVHNSTRGHEIVHDIREAVIYWKDMWAQKHKVTKNVQIVDIGRVDSIYWHFQYLRHSLVAGYNISVEAYSIFKSEVENFSDPLAALNKQLVANLSITDTEVCHNLRCSLVGPVILMRIFTYLILRSTCVEKLCLTWCGAVSKTY